MRRVLASLAAGTGALALASPAAAAYRPQLLVVPQGPSSAGATELAFSQGLDHDATARLEIAIPPAYRVALGQRAGTVLGPAAAEVTVRGFDVGAIPVSGRTVVADPAEHLVAAAACAAAAPVAVWRIELAAQTGQTLGVTVFVQAAGASVRLVACFPSPNVPEEAGGAPFGVKLVSARLTVAGVFGTPTDRGRHVWSGRFTPYAAGTANEGPAVESRVVVPVPARVTLARRTVGSKRSSVVLSGRVLEAGAGARRVRAELWAARDARGRSARRLAAARTGAKGAFSFRRTVAATRWYAVVVPSRDTTSRDCAASTAPGGCIGAVVAPIRSRWLKVAPPRRR